MPAPLVAAGIGLGAKLLSGLFKGKAEKKRAQASNKAAVAAANLADQRREDERTAGVDAGSSILGSIGQAPAYGGRVNPNMALDPALVARLKQRRVYDNSSAVPDAGAGLGSAFLSSLFGGAGDLAAFLPTGVGMPDMGAPMSGAGIPNPFTAGADDLNPFLKRR
jgi:hypothetical protein